MTAVKTWCRCVERVVGAWGTRWCADGGGARRSERSRARAVVTIVESAGQNRGGVLSRRALV